MNEFTKYEFLGNTQEFVDKANKIDKGIIEDRDLLKIKNSVILGCIAGIFALAWSDDFGFGKISLILGILSVVIGFYVAKYLIGLYHKKNPYSYLLRERHKRLQNKDEEKYIVYSNLLYVLTKDSVINLDDNMFKVRGAHGNWKFKEIQISDTDIGDELVIDVDNLKCWSRESKMG